LYRKVKEYYLSHSTLSCSSRSFEQERSFIRELREFYFCLLTLAVSSFHSKRQGLKWLVWACKILPTAIVKGRGKPETACRGFVTPFACFAAKAAPNPTYLISFNPGLTPRATNISLLRSFNNSPIFQFLKKVALYR
jgi:hypothetical protein